MRRTLFLLATAAALCNPVSAQKFTPIVDPFFDGTYIPNAARVLRACADENSSTCRHIVEELVTRNENLRNACKSSQDEKDCRIAKNTQELLSASFKALAEALAKK